MAPPPECCKSWTRSAREALSAGASGGEQRRNEAEKEGDADYERVGAQIQRQREGRVIECCGAPEKQGIDPEAEQETEPATGAGDDKPLSEQLTNDPPASRAEGTAEGDFSRTFGAKGQEQIGEIEARNQENAAGYAEESDHEKDGGVGAGREWADILA